MHRERGALAGTRLRAIASKAVETRGVIVAEDMLLPAGKWPTRTQRKDARGSSDGLEAEKKMARRMPGQVRADGTAPLCGGGGKGTRKERGPRRADARDTTDLLTRPPAKQGTARPPLSHPRARRRVRRERLQGSRRRHAHMTPRIRSFPWRNRRALDFREIHTEAQSE